MIIERAENLHTSPPSENLVQDLDLGIFSPKFLRERRKSFVHRIFSIRSITPGHDKLLAFILGLKLAPTSNGRAKVAATREVYLARHAEKITFWC